ncbi:MAG: transposase [Sphingobacteriales bacterium]|nr:transposase [Sphingobacteriales bacterium]
MANHQCFFYTETINGFKPLLKDDTCKQIIINSWKYLVQQQLANIYGFVIMPNHIHLLWTVLSADRKESVAGSFSKYTAHQFKKYLVLHNPSLLAEFASDKHDRRYQFWKRDPLAIPVTSENAFLQKLEYIHNNPVKEKWSLSKYPEEYRWSSANFYQHGVDEFELLTHYMR